MDGVVRRFEVARGDNGRYRWNSIADATGQLVGRSAIDYKRQENAHRAAKREVSLYPPGTAVVVVIED